MARRFRDTQTPEQQYAARQAAKRAHELLERARSAETEIGRLTAARRHEGQGGVTPVFGPHSDRDRARVDQLQAQARDLRRQADRIEADAKPKKRGWFR